jgi:hypothetical protein
MTPFIIGSQVNESVERLLKRQGFRFGVDFIIRKRNKPYMNSQLFSEYISTVPLPGIDELRTTDEFGDKEAVLPMDNCCLHGEAETRQMLADHRVKVMFLPRTPAISFRALI